MTRALAVVLVACACAPVARVSDPSELTGSPTTEDLRDVPVHGYDVVAVRHDGTTAATGELLAVTDTTLVVAVDGSRVSVPLDSLDEVRVKLYSDSTWAGMLTWGILGAASTATHGYFAVFTGPTWFLAGAVATGASYHGDGVARLWPASTHLAHFARFPQGLPPTISPSP